MQFKSISAALLCTLGLSAPSLALECPGKGIYYAPDGKLTLYVDVLGAVYESHLQHGLQTDSFTLDLGSFGASAIPPGVCTARYEPVTGQVVGDHVAVPALDMPAIDALGNRATVLYQTKFLINSLEPFVLVEIPGERIHLEPMLP